MTWFQAETIVGIRKSFQQKEDCPRKQCRLGYPISLLTPKTAPTCPSKDLRGPVPGYPEVYRGQPRPAPKPGNVWVPQKKMLYWPESRACISCSKVWALKIVSSLEFFPLKLLASLDIPHSFTPEENSTYSVRTPRLFHYLGPEDQGTSVHYYNW